MVDVGMMAPDFALRGSRGDEFRLSALRGKQRALLLFYPKDMTSGWTNQLVAVRDSTEAFRALDTEPYGVNPGDAESHQAFIDAHGFPFDLLVDKGRLVAETYGAIKPDGSGIQRTVVIVGKNGRVLYRAEGAPPPADLLATLRAADDE